jgi:hypothetical protein
MLTDEEASRLKKGEARELVSKSTKSGAGGAVDARSADGFNAYVAYQASRQNPLDSLPDLTKMGIKEAQRQSQLLAKIAATTGSHDTSYVDLPD